jgi:diguanylate cyclase (GGDEF)-like protein
MTRCFTLALCGLLLAGVALHAHAGEDDAFLVALTQAGAAEQIRMLVLQADTAIQQTEYQTAVTRLSEAYALLDLAQDDALARNVLNSLATLHYSNEDMAFAERYYQELIDLDTRSGDKLSLSVSHFNLGHVAASQQQFARADDAFKQALQLSLELDDPAGVAHALKAMGVNSQAQGDLATAKSNLDTALQKFLDLGDQEQSAVVMRNLAEVELARGFYQAAVDYYENALPILIANNDTVAAIPALRGLSAAYEKVGNYEKALEMHQIYADLLKAELEQQSMQSTQRVREQLGLRRFAEANAALENIRQQQELQLLASRRLVSLQYLVLTLAAGFLLLLGYMYKRSQQNARLMHKLATTDELTQMFNRRAIMDKGNHEWDRALRYNRPLSCLLFDVDHFKSINDTYGHMVGDVVLREISNELGQILRQTDKVGRIGGEEFFLLAAETSLLQARHLAERIRTRIAAMVIEGIHDRVITISIGIAHMQTSSSLEQMLQHADKALYDAKRSGRNCSVIYSPDLDEVPDSSINYRLPPLPAI